MGLEMNELERVLSLIESRIGQEEDLAYWSYHRMRYARSANSILQATRGMKPKDVRILDIGSHYLQLSSILSELGFSVFGIDVEEFAESELCRKRAELGRIEIRTMGDGLETGSFPFEDGERFDLVLFTETLEHLAFRPDRMWEGIFSLLRPRGQVYLTTPNALSLRRIPLQLLRLLSLRGYGPNLESLLRKPGNAQHWKEYTAHELRQYFKFLGYPVSVDVSHYRYKPMFRSDSLYDCIGGFCNLLAEFIPPLREELEVFIGT